MSSTAKTKTATPSTESKFDKNSSSGDYIYCNGGKDEYQPNHYKNEVQEEHMNNCDQNSEDQQNAQVDAHVEPYESQYMQDTHN